MSVINTNITSLIAQANLGKSQNALSTAMERLSSGMRINSAKDDAAGQAIANRMTAQITGLNQAQRNANDGISVAQTAEGALNQINDNIQRIRELSVQAANATNSEDDLTSIQDEIIQRQNEINRISEETDFNGTKVLASDQAFQIQVGANDGETIEVNLKEITSETLGLSAFDVQNQSLDTSKLSTSAITEASAGGLEFESIELVDSGASTQNYTIYQSNSVAGDYLIDIDGGATELYTATYNSTTGNIEITSTAGNISVTASGIGGYTALADGDEFVVGSSGGSDVIMDVANVTIVDNDTSLGDLYVGASDTGFFVKVGSDYFAATVDADAASSTYGTVTYDSTGASTSALVGGSAVTGGIVSDPADAVEINLSSVESTLGITGAELYNHADEGYVVKGTDADGQTVYFGVDEINDDGTVDLATADGENVEYNPDPLANIDAALKTVDDLRSELGAVQNRFTDAITNLQTNQTNLSAARSRIEDADYALEVANMTRAQILQQAGTSVLAQANQLPQNVLSLLG